MSKIIIHNESKVSDYVALQLVSGVVCERKINTKKSTYSKVHKCYVLTLRSSGNAHTFKVIDEVMDD